MLGLGWVKTRGQNIFSQKTKCSNTVTVLYQLFISAALAIIKPLVYPTFVQIIILQTISRIRNLKTFKKILRAKIVYFLKTF